MGLFEGFKVDVGADAQDLGFDRLIGVLILFPNSLVHEMGAVGFRDLRLRSAGGMDWIVARVDGYNKGCNVR